MMMMMMLCALASLELPHLEELIATNYSIVTTRILSWTGLRSLDLRVGTSNHCAGRHASLGACALSRAAAPAPVLLLRPGSAWDLRPSALNAPPANPAALGFEQ